MLTNYHERDVAQLTWQPPRQRERQRAHPRATQAPKAAELVPCTQRHVKRAPHAPGTSSSSSPSPLLQHTAVRRRTAARPRHRPIRKGERNLGRRPRRPATHGYARNRRTGV